MPAIAAGFAGLLSLFNIGGRFFWASLSDKIGRKNTYYTFFILGIALYALAPTFAAMGSKLLFVLGFGIILSMYGGGFATVPAYLADMFGTQFVGAIHGRLLTAWSTAGIIGPVVVNYIREFQLAAGVPRDQLYNTTMYILCAMLIAGLICNYLIKPVDPKWHMSDAEVAKLQAATASAGHRDRRARTASGSAGSTPRPRCSGPLSAFRWPGASGRRWKAPSRSSDREDAAGPPTCVIPRCLPAPDFARRSIRFRISQHRMALLMLAVISRSHRRCQVTRHGSRIAAGFRNRKPAASGLNAYQDATIRLASGMPEIRVDLIQVQRTRRYQ